MKTRKTKTTTPLSEMRPEVPKDIVQVEEPIETDEHEYKASKCPALSLMLPPAEVLWDLIGAMGCAYGGFLTSGHPLITVVAAGTIPLVVHLLRLSAAAFLRLEVISLFHNLFH